MLIAEYVDRRIGLAVAGAAGVAFLMTGDRYRVIFSKLDELAGIVGAAKS